MTTLEQLIAMRELLASPERWTKGALARDKFGNVTYYRANAAVCWCLLGALRKVAFGYDTEDTRRALVICLDDYNDARTTTHTDILRLLDIAIENEKERLNHA